MVDEIQELPLVIKKVSVVTFAWHVIIGQKILGCPNLPFANPVFLQINRASHQWSERYVSYGYK